MMTSCAPVCALSHPAMPPQIAPPTSPAIIATSRCSSTGRCHVNPTQPGADGARDELPLAADVEQPGPERQPRPTGRRRISGAALNRVSEIGPRIGTLLSPVNEPKSQHRALEQREVGARHRLPGRGERVPRVGEEVAHRRARRLVGDDDQHRADDDRAHERQHGDHDGAALADRARSPARPGTGARVLRRRRRSACTRLLVLAASPAISSPISSALAPAGDLARRSCPGTSPDPVGQPEHLVELGGDEHDGRAAVALGHDPLVHELDRADVEAAGRLRDDQQLQRPRQLAGEDDLLLVAAGQRVGRGVSIDGVRTSNSSTRSVALLRDRGRGSSQARDANGGWS